MADNDTVADATKTQADNAHRAMYVLVDQLADARDELKSAKRAISITVHMLPIIDHIVGRARAIGGLTTSEARLADLAGQFRQEIEGL